MIISEQTFLLEVMEMIKRLSGQEIFIIIAAVVALLFMYMTLIMTDSGPITTYDTYEEDDSIKWNNT